MAVHSLNLLGITLHSQTACAWLDDLYKQYDRPALYRPPQYQVEVRVRPEREPPGANAFPIRTHSSQVSVTLESDESICVHSEFGDAHLTLGSASSVIELRGDLRTSGDPLMVAFIEVLRNRRILPLHAAVLERDGQALTLFGTSGTGKSTTMLRALQQGFHPVSEDYALYEPESGLIYGLDLGIRCLPDTLTALKQEFPLASEPAMVRGKAFVPWGALGCVQVWQSPWRSASALLRDATGSSGETAFPVARRVMTLWAATGVPLFPSAREWTNIQIARLAQELKWSERILGSTPVSFEP